MKRMNVPSAIRSLPLTAYVDRSFLGKGSVREAADITNYIALDLGPKKIGSQKSARLTSLHYNTSMSSDKACG